ncbi:MAG: glycosyltransferase [Fimbriimonadaceae bacterium]|nr:glycosyltransferase [Fimbriimonadaceae bacterium]
MRIVAIDARPLADPGSEAFCFTLNLVHSLAFVDQSTEFHLFLDREPPADLVPARDNVKLTRLDAPSRLWKASALPAAARAVRADVLHVQGLLPAKPAMPVVTTLRHLDPIHHPRRYPGVVGWSWRNLLPRQIGDAAAVLVPWQAVRDDVVATLGLPAQRISVIPYGVEPSFRPQCESVVKYATDRLALPPKYVLGRLGSGAAAEVQAVYAAAGELGLPLVLDRAAGTDLPGCDGTDPKAWPALQSGAVVTILGCGGEVGALALLEAMACGSPAVGPSCPILRELAGQAATLGSPAEQAAALARLVADGDLRAAYLRGSLERAQRHSWPDFAEQTLAVYRRVIDAANG